MHLMINSEIYQSAIYDSKLMSSHKSCFINSLKSLQMSLLLPFLTLIKSRIGEDVAYEDRRFSRANVHAIFQYYAFPYYYCGMIQLPSLSSQIHLSKTKCIKTKTNPNLQHEQKLLKLPALEQKINIGNGHTYSIRVLNFKRMMHERA